ncbi:helix-turn-helix domain-containing protein [Kitasatospora aburaviensis]|uniref:TetR/AcrR family transcriptional regulator n=1 Tax=Kitasatospora aburaviensis TaxID=67265 RepID=A0ABW1F099_9ACTN
MGRPLRADAERSVRAILEAAERVLADNPAASMEQIAEAAGVARTTIHRRFASRQVLIDTLAASAVERLAQAVEDSRPDTAPPLVVLHRATVNVLRVKSAFGFALGQPVEPDSAVAAAWEGITTRCLELLAAARDEGLLDPAVDLDWARRVYYALIGEALHGPESDPDVLATKVVDTLLHGLGPR